MIFFFYKRKSFLVFWGVIFNKRPKIISFFESQYGASSWGGCRTGGQRQIPGHTLSIWSHLVHTDSLPVEEGPTQTFLSQEAQKDWTPPSASDKLLQNDIESIVWLQCNGMEAVLHTAERTWLRWWKLCRRLWGVGFKQGLVVWLQTPPTRDTDCLRLFPLERGTRTLAPT